MTDLEAMVLNQIREACNEYGGEAWAYCIQDYGSINGKQLSGAISSLSQKGLIVCEGVGKDSIIRIK